MAATRLGARVGRLCGQLAGLLGGLLAGHGAKAVDLPQERVEALVHLYDGGGVRAYGPAFLVRKTIADKVSLSGNYYIDSVSNASIDVVTTASPYRETRQAFSAGADYAVRDTLMTLSAYRSSEPDYTATSVGLDVMQEVFGGMTSVSMGFTKGSDDVEKKNAPEFDDYVDRWQYRVGVTQILSPRVLVSANAEIVAEDGFLGSPYRVARVFGALVPESNPRTRTSRAIKLRGIGDLGSRDALRAEYRYYWDTWDIGAHTLELGYSRHLPQGWLADGHVRYYTQSAALFFSDNAQQESTYVSRNRQLSDFNSVGVGGRLSYTLKSVPGSYEIKASGSYEFLRFNYDQFTDLRNGQLYSFNAHLLQLLVTATF